LTPTELRAFAIHIFTAAGAALAFGALVTAVAGRWQVMFLCLGAALIVDALDGPLARRFDIANRLPRWSGDVLDLVVDFLTYVFVPAFAISAGGLLPDLVAIPAAMVIVTTGAVYFADRQMKTKDNYFRGFPALWNIVALYLFVLKLPPWAAVTVVAVLAILTFAPFKFVHPVRVARLRTINVAALVLWTACALIALWRDLDPGPWVAGALVVLALYFFALGLTDRWNADDRAPP
jgi:phosphatidylcholine synthase